MNCMDCGNDIDWCTCMHNPLPGPHSPRPDKTPAPTPSAPEPRGEELLPCPFCGGSAEFRLATAPSVEVRCTQCGVKRRQKYFRMTKTQLREAMALAWNTRTEVARLQREAEGLTRELEEAREQAIKWPDYLTVADFDFLKGLRVFVTSREKIFSPTGEEMFDDLIGRLQAAFDALPHPASETQG